MRFPGKIIDFRFQSKIHIRGSFSTGWGLGFCIFTAKMRFSGAKWLISPDLDPKSLFSTPAKIIDFRFRPKIGNWNFQGVGVGFLHIYMQNAFLWQNHCFQISIQNPYLGIIFQGVGVGFLHMYMQKGVFLAKSLLSDFDPKSIFGDYFPGGGGLVSAYVHVKCVFLAKSLISDFDPKSTIWGLFSRG